MEKIEVLNVRYFHGKTRDGYRFTAAGILNGGVCELGVSLCGDQDKFCKSKGRSIATTRLLSQKNDRNIGRRSVAIIERKEKESETFAQTVAQFNEVSKKVFEKTFNLYNHKFELPF